MAARWWARSDYEAHRIALGVPHGGLDFAYGDAFPHETDMDQLGGIDFAKGCYVGQEVVSRIEHRGIARTRSVALRYDGATPESGAPITAGERQVGTMGSAARGRGIALIRLDRVAEARTDRACGGRRSDSPRQAGLGAFFVPRRDQGRRMNDQAPRQSVALSVAQAGPALHLVSRRRMGRAGIRRSRALRKTRARRFPGRPVVDHDPAQAREFSPRLRRL